MVGFLAGRKSLQCMWEGGRERREGKEGGKEGGKGALRGRMGRERVKGEIPYLVSHLPNSLKSTSLLASTLLNH